MFTPARRHAGLKPAATINTYGVLPIVTTDQTPNPLPEPEEYRTLYGQRVTSLKALREANRRFGLDLFCGSPSRRQAWIGSVVFLLGVWMLLSTGWQGVLGALFAFLGLFYSAVEE